MADRELDTFFQISSDLFGIADCKGNFHRINPAWEKTLGYSEEELCSSPLPEFVHPEDLEHTIKEIADCCGGGLACQFQNRMRCKDGSYRVLEWNITYSEERNLFVVARDITDLKRNGEDTEHKKEFVEKVVSNALNGIYIYDFTRRVNIFINRQYTRITGYTLEFLNSLGSEAFEALFHPDDLGTIKNHMQRVRNSAEGETHEVEYRFKTSDNQWIWCLSRDAVFSRNKEGGVAQIIGTFIDTTKRKKFEEDLQRNRERYALAEAAVNDGLWDWNIVTREAYVSPRWKEIIGYQDDEIEAEESIFFERIHPDDKGMANEVLRQHLEENKRYRVELRLRHKSGDYVWILTRGVSVRDEQGRPVRMVGTITDITERKRSARALRESELRYRRLAEYSPDMIYRMSVPDGKYEYVSPASSKIFGYTPNEWYENPLLIRDIIHPEWHEYFSEQWENLLKGKVPPTYEYTFIHKDGSLGWANQRNILVKDGEGEVVAIEGIVTDITKRKKFEERLEKNEERLRLVVKGSNDAPWDWDLLTNDLFYSPQWWEQLGYEPDELEAGADLWQKLMHPIDAQRVQALFQDKLSSSKSSYEVELRLLHKQGHYVPILSRGFITRDGNGEPIRVTGTNMDLTERKKAEAERERLLKCIEQSGEATIITNVEGEVIYANKAFEKETGYSLSEALGKTPRILKSGVHDEEFYERLWDTISSGNTFQGRIVNRRKNGELHTDFATISPVFDDGGKIVNYVCVKRDITEYLQMEAQLRQAQKMDSIGQLAGGVAHDYNNSLSVILGFTELVMQTVDPDGPIYDDLSEVLKAAQRSADITRQLLAFARKQTVMPKVLDLNDTVGGMLKMLQRLIGEDIKLVWQPQANLWKVKIDPSQVDQILANLAVNARQAINGVGTIVIETTNIIIDEKFCENNPGMAVGENAVLRFTDNGFGISEAEQGKIFEPFYTTKKLGEGTGLGLATVYGIVKQNKGFIAVESSLNKGTTFNIYLPRHPEEDKLEELPEQSDFPKGSGETLLIVEDEEGTLKLTRRVIEELGYTVLAARTPGEALRLAEDHQSTIEMLLTDVVLPEMNGKVLAEKLKIDFPEMKILFMSGYTADIITRQGVLVEGVNFIQKPFSTRELAVKVRQELDKTEA